MASSSAAVSGRGLANLAGQLTERGLVQGRLQDFEVDSAAVAGQMAGGGVHDRVVGGIAVDDGVGGGREGGGC